MTTGIALIFFMLRAWRTGQTHPMLLLLIVSCGGQSVLVALHQFYHLGWLRPIQPVTASSLPADGLSGIFVNHAAASKLAKRPLAAAAHRICDVLCGTVATGD